MIGRVLEELGRLLEHVLVGCGERLLGVELARLAPGILVIHIRERLVLCIEDRPVLVGRLGFAGDYARGGCVCRLRLGRRLGSADPVVRIGPVLVERLGGLGRLLGPHLPGLDRRLVQRHPGIAIAPNRAERIDYLVLQVNKSDENQRDFDRISDAFVLVESNDYWELWERDRSVDLPPLVLP